MSGMTTSGSAGVSDYTSRSVIIKVTGLVRQDMMKTSNYEVKVPFSQMSKTMQNIGRLGGKVASVTVVGVGSASASDTSDHHEEGHQEND